MLLHIIALRQEKFWNISVFVHIYVVYREASNTSYWQEEAMYSQLP